jgi:hypothetical protein
MALATILSVGETSSSAIHAPLSVPFEPTGDLLIYGEKLFKVNWTQQEGGGRPLSKGTGRPLAEASQNLTDLRLANRVSAPDANSCASCHNAPYGIVGGGGDFVTGVFVLGQRFDFMTFDRTDTLPLRGAVDEGGKPASLQDAGDYRATTGMFGAGYLEMLARQMTAELQRTRDSIRRGEAKELVAKGVPFGTLTLKQDGLWDTSKVTGLGRLSVVSGGTVNPPTLIIRPWHQASNVVSLREFTNTAFNQHHGIQSTERLGIDTDPDGDGVKNEMTRADVTAVARFQETLTTGIFGASPNELCGRNLEGSRRGERPTTPMGAPERADDDVLFVEGVVDVAGHLPKVDAAKAGHICAAVKRASSGEECQDAEGLFELSGEDLGVGPVCKPPEFLANDLRARRRGQSDAALAQCDRSSLRISSASISRPAATSASDSRSALWSAARSASSSQSPGSSGRSSNSVPSGRLVGSSTTSRPAVTRALMVMCDSVALGGPPNKRWPWSNSLKDRNLLGIGGKEIHL